MQAAYRATQQATPKLVVRAPGRINLIGEHTDYNLGLSLPAAIDKAIYFLIGPSETPQIYAHDLSQSWSIGNDIPPSYGWAHYFEAMHQLLIARGLVVPPLACVFGGNIPLGAGLSSSAALCCGYLFALDQWQSYGLSRHDIAALAQAAEHRVGIQCGLLDQLAVLFGKTSEAVLIDFESLQLTPFSLQLGDYAFMLLNTRVTHSLVDSAYNQRRVDCEAVLAQVQVQYPAVASVSRIDQAMLEEVRPQLAGKQYERVRFVLEENQRVRAAAQACQAGDLKAFGQYLYQSHAGLRDLYEVSCPELDLLVALSQEEPAILGARMMGGGFGGCTLNLVRRDEREASATRILAAYQQQTGIEGEAIFVQTAEGVELVAQP